MADEVKQVAGPSMLATMDYVGAARMAEEERSNSTMRKLGSMRRYLGQRSTETELRDMTNELDCDCDDCLDALLARKVSCTKEELTEALEGFCSCGCWEEQRAEPAQKKRRRRKRRGGDRPEEKLLTGLLVMFMHAGLAMLGTGCCRAKHASNTLMKNLDKACVCALAWFYTVKQGVALAMLTTMDYIRTARTSLRQWRLEHEAAEAAAAEAVRQAEEAAAARKAEEEARAARKAEEERAAAEAADAARKAKKEAEAARTAQEELAAADAAEAARKAEDAETARRAEEKAQAARKAEDELAAAEAAQATRKGEKAIAALAREDAETIRRAFRETRLERDAQALQTAARKKTAALFPCRFGDDTDDTTKPVDALVHDSECEKMERRAFRLRAEALVFVPGQNNWTGIYNIEPVNEECKVANTSLLSDHNTLLDQIGPHYEDYSMTQYTAYVQTELSRDQGASGIRAGDMPFGKREDDDSDKNIAI